MTKRSTCLCIAVLSLACGPSGATPLADDDTTGTTDTSGTSGASDGSDGDDASSSLDDLADDDTTSDTASGEVTSSDSTETSTTVPDSARYELVGVDAVLEPEGCAAARGGQPSAWTIEIALPTADGAFAMIETFGPYVTELACTLEGDTFACARVIEVDYARFSDKDALVHHASAYEAGWDGDELVGTYTADFACEGEDCTSVREEWRLVAFPCGLQVPFTGVLARAQ